jgi:MFS family permease
MNSTIEFRKLLFASLVSQAGSHFLTLSIASFILLETHSIVKASLVFSFSFLPSVFVSAKLGAWVDRSISRKLLIFNDVLAAVLSAVCGFCFLL